MAHGSNSAEQKGERTVKTLGGKQLTEAYFRVVKEIYTAQTKGQWYEVVNPEGDEGVVLRQANDIWHFFFKDFEGTASGSCPERCYLDGLGDAIGTDAQLETYKKYLYRALDRLLAEYDGLYRAATDALNA